VIAEPLGSAPKPRLVAIPVLVLVATVVLTGQVWREERNTAREHARQTAERAGQQMRDTLVERFGGHEVALNGLRAIFAASRSVERAEWRSFVENHQVRALHRCTLGFSYIARVDPEDVAEFAARARKDEAPGFEVHIPEGFDPLPPGTERAIVLFHEPHDLHAELLGLDVSPIPALSEALWRSARTGELAASDPVADFPGLDEPIVFLSSPVYRRGTQGETPEQRLERLVGWVAMPLRIAEMMEQLATDEPQLGIELHTGTDTASMASIFRSAPDAAPPADRQGHRIEFGGRLWQLHAWNRDRLAGSSNLGTLAAGSVIGFLTAGVLWSLLRTRSHALELAARMTASLRRSQKELSAALESEEQARREADGASRAKSEFLANMSHEIRTPMTAILGFSELLLEGEPSEEDRRRHLLTIRRNGEHLLSIINDILDLSKIESGRLEVEAMPVRVRSLVDEVVALFGPRAEAKGISLSVEIDSGVPLEVRTDPVRLRQVIVNLVGNAVKFTETGSVRISVARDRDDPKKLRIAIADTGIGIPPEKLADIFLPFQQADTSTTRHYGGTGLGLAISSRLIAMLGGRISVTSSPGTGSTFTFTIAAEEIVRSETPPPEPEPPAPARSPERPAEVRGGRVLLAEDGPDNQRLIGLVLGNAGFSVDIAENGAIALERALAEWRDGSPYDVILMDMQMPEMDGYSATRRLREEGYDGRIVALTAHAMVKDRERCLAAGCDEFASKPIDRKTIVEIVGRSCALARAE